VWPKTRDWYQVLGLCVFMVLVGTCFAIWFAAATVTHRPFYVLAFVGFLFFLACTLLNSIVAWTWVGRRVRVRTRDLLVNNGLSSSRTVSASQISGLDIRRRLNEKQEEKGSWGVVVGLDDGSTFWLDPLDDRQTVAPSPQWVAMIEEIRNRLGVGGTNHFDKPLG
jgi:hypothetical protein